MIDRNCPIKRAGERGETDGQSADIKNARKAAATTFRAL